MNVSTRFVTTEHRVNNTLKTRNSLLPQPLGSLVLGCFFCILATFFQVRNSYGQEADITNFTVSNSESHLLLYLTVSDWLTNDMKAAIQNGIPITLAFSVELFAIRSNWPDKKITHHEFTHTMAYDSLKKEYTITRNEKDDTRVSASFAEAERLMSEINGFQVMPLDELDPLTSYTLRAKAKLARKTLPSSFHYIIPFSSPWDFETNWHELTMHIAL